MCGQRQRFTLVLNDVNSGLKSRENWFPRAVHGSLQVDWLYAQHGSAPRLAQSCGARTSGCDPRVRARYVEPCGLRCW